MTDLAAQAREQKMRITLLPVAQSPHIARTFIRHGLLNLHMPDLVDDACLIASELVGNAVKHVPDADKYELTLSHNQGRPLIETWDPSPKPPMIINLPGAESGRGLHIINALASTWNYYILPPEIPHGGKIVWALLRPEQNPYHHTDKMPNPSIDTQKSSRRTTDYLWVAQIIRERITTGDWPANHKILTQQDLVQIFDVKHQTIREAIAHLCQRGYLMTVPNKGTYVRPPQHWTPEEPAL